VSVSVVAAVQQLTMGFALQNPSMEIGQGALALFPDEWDWWHGEDIKHSLQTAAETMTPTTFLADAVEEMRRFKGVVKAKDMTAIGIAAADVVTSTRGGFDLDVLTDATAGLWAGAYKMYSDYGMKGSDYAEMVYRFLSMPKSARNEIVEALRVYPVLNEDGTQKIGDDGKPVMAADILRTIDAIAFDEAMRQKTSKIFPDNAEKRFRNVTNRWSDAVLTRAIGPGEIEKIEDPALRIIYQMIQKESRRGFGEINAILKIYRLLWEHKNGLTPKVITDNGKGLIGDGNEWFSGTFYLTELIRTTDFADFDHRDCVTQENLDDFKESVEKMKEKVDFE
jgi:hypothetical protein